LRLALFDFDGTITNKDSWTAFLRFSATPQRIIAATVLLSPLIVAYKLGWISGRRGRPVVARFAFYQTDAAAVRAKGRTFAREILPTMLQRRALERIAWHQQQGDTVVVVSASLDVYLADWCEAAGVDLICTVLEDVSGSLTGRYAGGDCCGPEKVRRINQRYDLARYSVVYAYGDTAEDREMLELADQKFYRWKAISDCHALDSPHPPSV
jgi:phosphatidylglycerophosphatase C